MIAVAFVVALLLGGEDVIAKPSTTVELPLGGLSRIRPVLRAILHSWFKAESVMDVRKSSSTYEQPIVPGLGCPLVQVVFRHHLVGTGLALAWVGSREVGAQLGACTLKQGLQAAPVPGPGWVGLPVLVPWAVYTARQRLEEVDLRRLQDLEVSQGSSSHNERSHFKLETVVSGVHLVCARQLPLPH
uniref:Secreted protein n=1 Tax=Timema monikensis TaxID=170555 RepID=A0A7R9DZG4_9NEOP|nr:unnamed protein product [Timema monikensis]